MNVDSTEETSKGGSKIMKISIMSWNMAGAKLLKTIRRNGSSQQTKEPLTNDYIEAYNKAWRLFRNRLEQMIGESVLPDILLLQECIGFASTSSQGPSYRSGEQILREIFEGYACYFFPALSNRTHPHPRKWAKYGLPTDLEVQQGYGVCIREPDRLRKLWRHDSEGKDVPNETESDLCFEAVNLTTGAYLGNRDTEPRLAVWGRLKLKEGTSSRYINFVNVHLTTLKGEREGNLQKNRDGVRIRTSQIELIVENVVSAYHHPDAIEFRYPTDSLEHSRSLWIVAGDFNSTPDSQVVALMTRSGFIDGNPFKQLLDQTGEHHNEIATKWVTGKPNSPPTVLDYIFFGLNQTSFPIGSLPGGVGTGGVRLNDYITPFRPKFDDTRFETDHAMIFASFNLD